MIEKTVLFERFKQRIQTGFIFQMRKANLLRSLSSESKRPVQFVEWMKIWISVLWFEADNATTHFIVDALKAGSLIAE